MDITPKKDLFLSSKYWFVLLGLFSLGGLYAASFYNSLLFHSLAEIFSIVIACCIFMFVWNSRRFLDNSCLLFIGIAYLFIGFLDLFHTLSYKGMGVFPGYDANLPTQFWILGRYMESLSLAIAPLFLGRELRPRLVFGVYLIVTLFLIGILLTWNIFPECFIEGKGLTPFKKISEYMISLILLCSIILFSRKKREFDKDVFVFLIASIILTVCSELVLTFYVSVYGFPNALGHFFKIVSFYLIYRAIIVTSLNRPYDILFRSLKQSEEKLLLTQFSVERAAEAVYWVNKDAQLIYVNEQACRSLGYSKEELLGKTIMDIDPNIDVKKWKEHWEKKKEMPFEKIETLHKKKDGTVFPVEVNAQYCEFGGEEYGFAFVRDITQREFTEEKLKAEIDKLTTLTEGLSLTEIGVHIVDRDYRIHYQNQFLRERFGEISEHFCYQHFKKLDEPCETCPVQKTMETKDLEKAEQETPDGRVYEILAAPLINPDGTIDRVIEVIKDITERKQVEEALRESEARYRSLFEDSPVALWEEDFSAVKNYIDKLKEEGVTDFRSYFKKNPSEMKKCAKMVRIVDVNNAAVNMLGYRKEELLKNLLDIFRDESLVVFLEELVALAEGKTEFESEAINKSIYRDRIYVNLKMTVVPGHEKTWSKVLISITDITERKLIEQHIRRSLEEKDTLLKEIHHRVKNNMQIISSLLTLQSESSKDKEVHDVFEQCKLRIKSMALVHEKLYQTEDLANINIKVYIKSLVRSILDSYGKDWEKIASQFDIGEITLDIDTAIPIGLIINELVSNSLKYAFGEERTGEIGVSFHESGEDSFMMKVWDNGVGFPEDIDFKNTDTLGLQLVTILTEGQLDGSIELYPGKGTEFHISFKKKKKTGKDGTEE